VSMQYETDSRNSLVRALARVVLDRETIWRHAQSHLLAPELVEVASPISAVGLWNAVFERAEVEGVALQMVRAVLEENPGAADITSTFQGWQRGSRCRWQRRPRRWRASSSGWIVAALVIAWHVLEAPGSVHLITIVEADGCDEKFADRSWPPGGACLDSGR